jgi:hypothetical protein
MRGLNFESKMGHVAKEIERAAADGLDVDFDYLQERLGQELSRKEIADCASSLYKRGYVQRMGHGKYRASQKLHQLADKELGESLLEQTRPPEAPAEVVVRKKSREEREVAAQEIQETDFDRLDSLLQRLEACLDRLERIAARLDKSADLQDVMDLMEKALAKGKSQQ